MIVFKCLNCGRIFFEPKLINNYILNDYYYEKEEVCPYCNNFFIEIGGDNEDDDKKALAKAKATFKVVS